MSPSQVYWQPPALRLTQVFSVLKLWEREIFSHPPLSPLKDE